MKRIKDEKPDWRYEMEYKVEYDDFQAIVEKEKDRVKNQILQSYIKLRREKGITQKEIADRTGIQRTNIVRIESGKYVPTIEVLVKLALALDMTLEVRLNEKE